MNDINLWAVLLAAALSFALGGLWYSRVLFEGVWIREAKDPRPAGSGHPAAVFGLSFGFALIAAFAFAYWIGSNPPLGTAVLQGLSAGACFVAASLGINYQFANRSMLLWLIDGGYHTVQFVIFGLVLGLWH